MIQVQVDFNDLDDRGHVLALRRLVPEVPQVGEWLRLIDDEGNSVSGVVSSGDTALIHVDADWDTWNDTDEEGFVQEGGIARQRLDNLLPRADLLTPA